MAWKKTMFESNRKFRRNGRAWLQERCSIRVRLILLALIAALPVFVDRIRDAELDRAERIEAAHKQVRELAQRGASDQNDMIETTRAFLQVVGRSYATFGGSGEVCGRFLANLTTGLPWAKAISVTDPSGLVICSSNPGSLGRDVSDRPHFQRAMKTGEFVVSDYQFGQRLPGANIVTMLPHRRPDGSIEIVVSGVLDINWLGRIARTMAERSGSVVLMVDGGGTVITRQPDPGNWVGRQLDNQPLIMRLITRSEGVISEKDVDGVRRIYGFVQLPGTQTRLAVGLDEEEVLHNVSREMGLTYLQLGLIVALVLVAIWLTGERLIVKPIQSLARSARRFGRGELGEQVGDKPWVTEFIPLAAALDDMANELALRENELRSANDRLRALAAMDGLTGLANRRELDLKLAIEWQMAIELQHPIALMIIDIDHFKLFNDHYGHPEGDFCLRRVGKVLSAAIRKDTDLAVRYGGEEFVLLLPVTDVAEALDVAERLRRAVEDLRIAHAAAPSGHVTISVGVAALVPAAGEAAERLIDLADAALYAAKRRGRNAVIVHEAMTLAAAS
jgi:diguanylate cyclase (GGDEF)-like protein